MRALLLSQYDLYLCALIKLCIKMQGAASKWTKRRPRWLVVERCHLHGMWRASQAKYKWFATTNRPATTVDDVPPTVKVMMSCMATAAHVVRS